MDLFRPIRRAWIQYREFEKVRIELADSSDRQLADLGIARGDIGRIALEHAERFAAEAVPARTGSGVADGARRRISPAPRSA
jgi:uncharacterized protein YjiS (DUF1127 family)